MPLRDAPRHRWVAAGTASLLGAVPALACAQGPLIPEPRLEPVRVETVLDVGAASVDYDEFLPSSLVSLSGLVRVDGARAGIAVRGSVARYVDTGNLNAQAGLSLGTTSDPWRGVRGELGLVAVVGSHQTVGSSGTGQVVARVHGGSATTGAWAGGGVGWASSVGSYAVVGRGDLGLWRREGPLRATLTVAPTRAGRLGYVDFVGALRWSRDRLDLSGTAGVRAGDVPPTAGLAPEPRGWGSVDAMLWLGRRLAVTATVGRAPSDPAAGTGGGRYAAAGLRVATGGTRGVEAPRVLLPRASLSVAAADAAAAPARGDSAAAGNGVIDPAGAPESLAVVELGGGAFRLDFDLAAATTAEIMGDVTNWEPRPLERTPDGRWTTTLTLAPGVHRLNLRTDAGPWRVPPLLTAVDDGFGGQVGLLVVRR